MVDARACLLGPAGSNKTSEPSASVPVKNDPDVIKVICDKYEKLLPNLYTAKMKVCKAENSALVPQDMEGFVTKKIISYKPFLQQTIMDVEDWLAKDHKFENLTTTKQLYNTQKEI